MGGLPKKQQLEQLTRYIWERIRNKVIRQAIRPKASKLGHDPMALLNALRRQEAGQQGVVSRVAENRDGQPTTASLQLGLQKGREN